MVNKKYEIKYNTAFAIQLNSILSYITYELGNKIAANNLYDEVFGQIEIRSKNPESFQIYKTIRNGKIKYYKINVKNYIILYTVKNNIMEIRRICYSRRDIDKLI